MDEGRGPAKNNLVKSLLSDFVGQGDPGRPGPQSVDNTIIQMVTTELLFKVGWSVVDWSNLLWTSQWTQLGELDMGSSPDWSPMVTFSIYFIKMNFCWKVWLDERWTQWLQKPGLYDFLEGPGHLWIWILPLEWLGLQEHCWLHLWEGSKLLMIFL